MRTIEAYHYKIGLDVSSLQGGGVVTRRELSQIRRDLRSLQDPVEKSAAKLDRFRDALHKGAMDAHTYAVAVGRIKATYPEVIAEKQRMLDVDRQVSAIRQKLTTDEERYQQEIKRTAELIKATRGTDNPFTHTEAQSHLASFRANLPTGREQARRDDEAGRIAAKWTPDHAKFAAEQARLNELVEKHGLSVEAAARELEEYRSRLPGVIDAQRQTAAAMTDVQRITAAGMTDSQRYAAERARVAALVRDHGLAEADAARHLQAYRAQLPSVINAERELAQAKAQVQQITAAGMTDSQRYAAERARVTELVKKHGLAEADARRHLQSYRSQLPSVVAAETQRRAVLGQVESIVRSNETATERYHRRLRELHQVYRTGQLDAKNYLRELKQITAEHDSQGDGVGRFRVSLRGGTSAAARGAGGAAMARAGGFVGLGYLLTRGGIAGAKGYSKIEQAQSNLEVFTGSLEKAGSLLAGLRDLSPQISLDSYAAASQTFLTYNLELERVTPTLSRLGDIASGNEERFNRLAYAVAEVTNLGRLQGGEFRQLINAGFNPLRTYADATGESMDSLRQKMAEGRFTAQMLHEAIEHATNAGGTYHGLLAKQATTVAGSFASLRSEASALGASLMEPIAIGAGYLARQAAAAIRFVRPKGYDQRLREPTPLTAEREAFKQPSGRYGLTDEDIQKAELERNATLSQEIERLKTRNMELRKGVEWTRTFEMLNSGASQAIQDQYRVTLARNKELERQAKITQQTEAIQQRITQEQTAIAIRSHYGIPDEGTASQLAQLRILGATGAELEQHLAMHRELAQLERVRTAESERYARVQQLHNDALSIRESFRTPMQSLAVEFRDLAEMFDRGLLTSDQYSQARLRSARELLNVHQQLATQTLAVDDGSSIYSAMIEDQNRRERAAIEDAQAMHVQRQVEALAQRENERLIIQRQITDQMRQQALAAQAIQHGSGAAGGDVAAGGPGGNTDHLDRIAAASERTAQALSKWQMVGV